MGKDWYTSKTLWFGILSLIVALAGIFGFNEWQPTADVSGAITAIVAIINIVLRVYFTDKPLVLKRPK